MTTLRSGNTGNTSGMVSCGSCVTSSACVLIAMVPPLSDQPSTFAWGCAGTADCRRLAAAADAARPATGALRRRAAHGSGLAPVRSLGPALRALRGLWQHDGEHAVVIGGLHLVPLDVAEHRHLQAELAVEDAGQVIGGGAEGH